MSVYRVTSEKRGRSRVSGAVLRFLMVFSLSLVVLIILTGLFRQSALLAYGESESVPALQAGALESMELQLFGVKFLHEPLEDRLKRLETRLKNPSPEHATDEYRLAQLHLTATSQVPKAERQNAVRAYNQAIDEAEQGNTEAAMGLYRKALQHNPGFVQASNNLAGLLEKKQRYEEAIEIYRQAIAQFPPQEELALLYRNLGVVSEKVGQSREAILAYKDYLRLTPEPDESIEAIVRSYDSNHAGSETSPDYAAVAKTSSEGKALLWPEYANPVPVCILVTEPEQVVYLPVVQNGLRQWEKALSGRLRFKEVAQPPNAGIQITLLSGPLAHPVQEVGHAQYELQEDGFRPERMKVLIRINTGAPSDPESLMYRKEQVAIHTLHEIGHALGIWGHSADPNDIMFTHPIVSHLSKRDLQTVRKLYALN